MSAYKYTEQDVINITLIILFYLFYLSSYQVHSKAYINITFINFLNVFLFPAYQVQSEAYIKITLIFFIYNNITTLRLFCVLFYFILFIIK